MHAAFDPVELLRVLEAHGVRHVVIGGFAAWMQGERPRRRPVTAQTNHEPRTTA